MNATTVKRTGEFKLLVKDEKSRRSSYPEATVEVEIYGKNAEMTFQEGWETVKLMEWHFVTGDAVIDSAAKIQTDFAAFDLLDITVDITEITNEAKAFFEALKVEKKAKEEEQAKINRGKGYDQSFFLNELKPALEAKGYTNVYASISREDYVNGKGDLDLIIKTDDRKFRIDYDYHHWVRVSNGVYDQNQRVDRSTRSSKLPKILEMIGDAIESDKNIAKRIQEKITNLRGAKETLENALGIKMACKKEYHSYNNYGRGNRGGYETEYFVDEALKDEYSGVMKFTESSKTVDGKSVRGFQISNLPTITDMAKLKQIYELLISK